MKKRMLVIVNPISGVGRQKKIERLLNTNLDHDLYDHEVRYTERIHHGTELARQGAMEGFDVITAVGGDGSVNDVIAGMHGSEATLGIIPCGSGNGLARCMKIPLTPAFAIRVLNQNNPGLILRRRRRHGEQRISPHLCRFLCLTSQRRGSWRAYTPRLRDRRTRLDVPLHSPTHHRQTLPRRQTT